VGLLIDVRVCLSFYEWRRQLCLRAQADDGVRGTQGFAQLLHGRLQDDIEINGFLDLAGDLTD
jgi:hypothetical protein